MCIKCMKKDTSSHFVSTNSSLSSHNGVSWIRRYVMTKNDTTLDGPISLRKQPTVLFIEI